MTYRNISRLLFIFMILISSAFAVINYNGYDYTETMLPLTISGEVTVRYVVMGTGLSITSNNTANSNTRDFDINEIDYKGAGTGSVTASTDDRYFIYLRSKSSATSITVTGTNDWTTQSYTSQAPPFSQSGSGSYFYSLTGSIDSILTSNMGFFLINNVDYTNQTVTSLPGKINDTYYLYYGTTNTSGSLNVTEYTPKLNMKLFLEGDIW